MKVKGKSDISSLWRRMLLTIDGVNEPEVNSILKIIPNFEKIKKLKGKNDENLFNQLCQAPVFRGEGALRREQRLGPKLAERILNTFDDKDRGFILN